MYSPPPPRPVCGTLCRVLALVSLACLSLADRVSAAPLISEFLAINSGEGLVDSDGDSSDWIEIHNPDAVAVDLEGYSLTDDEDRPMRWQFPAVSLDPGAYLIVFASGKDRAVAGEELHADFSLDGDGEFLMLSDAGATPLSAYAPEFPEQQRDISYGGRPGEGFGYYVEPTPGAPNGERLTSLTAPPTFSAPHGFYQSPVQVEIEASNPTSIILYTTDGSVPTRLNSQIYREPIVVGSTTVLRAVAAPPGAVPSGVVTSTYLFPADIKNQPRMTQDIAAAPEYAPEIESALTSLPVMSLAMPESRFLGPDGIYTNFQERGRDAEVPVSVEYFDPDGEGNSDGGFQIDAGIRIHGGQARFHEKKPMRLYFRSDYGAGRLDYPLFPESPVDEFDRLILRSCGHDGWAIDWGNGRNDLTETATYIRDEFVRRSEHEMGLLSPYGKFVHVFVNGEYWGMYDLHERADSAFFASHRGGDEDDWDVIEGGGAVKEGDATAWNDLLSLGTTGVTNAAQYSEVEQLLDVDDFIDSMISRMWSGDNDWLGPVFFGLASTGLNNRNWFSGRRSRSGGQQPFYFFAWDAEISLGNDRFLGSGNRLLQTDLTQVNTPNSPSVPYAGLRGYEEFQIKFSDRLYRAFFNDGVFTTARSQARWDALSDRVRSPLVAESARWGQIHGGVPLRRDVEWESERLWVRDTFLVQRPEIVLDQFRARGLYPSFDPPQFPSAAGGEYPAAVAVTLAPPAGQTGEIYYTLDGSDPRQPASVDVETLLPANSPGQVLVPSTENGGDLLGDTWFGFDDPLGIENWTGGAAAVGFEQQGSDYRSLLQIDVGEEMFGINGSVYLRVAFDVPDQETIDSIDRLILKMKYDDGFVAFLNGERVAEANAPAGLAWDSLATGGQPDSAAVLFQEFDISAQRDLLRVGRNVLALQGMNGAIESSDLLLVPEIQARGTQVDAGISAAAQLYAGGFTMAQSGVVKARFLSSGGVWSALREELYLIGDPPAGAGDLVISEINYHPRDPSGAEEEAVATGDGAFEFIEVLNVSAETVEMGGVRFDDGIDFVFPAGGLAPGGRLLVVKDQAAFAVRYPAIPAALIAGEFDDTSLSNGGEDVVLVDALGEVILDFEYDDKAPWPTEPDGGGATLVLIDPSASPDPGLAASWRASRLPDGAPGGDENALDTDLDSLPDDWEMQFFNDLAQDAGGNLDGDGWDHLREFMEGTNPLLADTDDDGLSDSEEEGTLTDPTNPDTDGDGLSDGDEVLTYNTRPLERDSDGDGLEDDHEVLISMTDPNARDSDGDGSGDFSEVRRGTDPNDAAQTAMARSDDFLIYASMDSLGLTAGASTEGMPQEISGVLAGGLRLATGDQLGYGQVGDPGANSLSAVIWFKLEPGEVGSRILASKGEAWRLETGGGTVTLQVAGLPEIQLAAGVEAGNWHQVAMVVDREVQTVRGFFDGVEIRSEAITGDAILDSAQELRLGSGNGGPAICIDEFSLFRFALGAEEVGNLFGGRAAGLRAVDLIGSGDSDLDGLGDEWELAFFGDLTESGEGDPDGDGLDHLAEFRIGTNPLLADSDGDGTGDRDEVMMGTDPLVGSVIAALADDLLLHSSFDLVGITGTGSGSRVFDLSSPSENGIVNGGLTSVPGAVGEAVRMTSGQINYGDVHDPGDGSYSVSIWFQADRLSPGIIQRVVGKGVVDLEGNSVGWQILVLGDEVAVIGGTAGGAEFFLRGMPAGQARLRVGDWNHVVMVIDREPGENRIRLFVNGEEVSGDGLETSGLPDGGQISSEQPLVTHSSGGAGDGFAGAIDSLAIWGRPLSASDVGALYRGGLLTAGIDQLTGAGGLDPQFSAGPGSISVVLNPGEMLQFDGVLKNAGEGRANWFAGIEFVEELTLETALERIDAGAAQLLEPIPFRYAFQEGVVGSSIGDGGLDMFDGGNILNTDRGRGIPYSDGAVIGAEAFGEAGRYFTRKLPGGLFVLGADLDGVEYFEISGDLGADGVGSVDGTVLSIERSGRRFLGFVKRVYDGVDTFTNIFDPSVNHLIIIEDNGVASQTFPDDTNNDQHRVSGLVGVRRLYHLLYASQDGLRISDEDTLAIFETFIDTVGVAPGWVRLPEEAGQVEPGAENPLGLDFDAGNLAPGIEVATLRLFSNDPLASELEIPVQLRINAAPVALSTVQIDGDEDLGPLEIDLDTVFDDDGEVDGETLSYELVSVSDPDLIDLGGTGLDGSVLEVSLEPDAFGRADLVVRATDPQGLSAATTISVVIAPVNDLPMAIQDLQLSVDEDSGPVLVNLRQYFGDVEDGSAGLSFALGVLGAGSPLGPPFLDAASGNLVFGLVRDANGPASIPLRVVDSEGGTLETSLQVLITPVPDSPERFGSIPPVVADEAASDQVISIAPFFRDADRGDVLTYSIVNNTNPGLFSALRVDPASGELTIAYAPFVSGRAEITVRASDPTGRSADQVFEVVLPEIDVPGVELDSQLRLNRQTGLWEQVVTITNGARRDIGAVRLLVGGLADGIIVYNASHLRSDGRAEVLYNRTLPAGETVSLILEYYSADRSGHEVTPTLEVEVSLRETAVTMGTTFAIDRVVRLEGGETLVEFPAEPGELYMVQHSTDLKNWKDTLVRLRAGGTRVQWIDRDGTSTGSIPRSRGARYYRVLHIDQ